MQIKINNHNGIPIYDQIYTQIKDQIIGGSLKEDTLLPSIRNLAKDLRISVITTKRAYEELEKERFINTIPGKGSYVSSKNTELIREHHLKQIEQHIDDIKALSKACELSEKEIHEMIRLLWREEE